VRGRVLQVEGSRLDNGTCEYSATACRLTTKVSIAKRACCIQTCKHHCKPFQHLAILSLLLLPAVTCACSSTSTLGRSSAYSS
jgi:hypothetical protein